MHADHSRQELFSIKSDDGLTLSSQIHTPVVASEALPVICLSGLSRNSRDFEQLARQIARDPEKPRRVICPDYRGRGQSDWDSNPENYNILREAEDIIALLRALEITRAHFIGTSRGGLIMQWMPALAPDRIASVILNDIGPVVEMAGMAQIRDYLAVRPQPVDWRQAARALKATHALGFPVFDDGDWMDMAKALFSDRDGAILPDFDPALAAPLKQLDLSQPLPDLWPQFESLKPWPLLSIRGEFSTLLSVSTVAAMKMRIPTLQTFIAAGQAHAPILHKHGPEKAISAFHARLD